MEEKGVSPIVVIAIVAAVAVAIISAYFLTRGEVEEEVGVPLYSGAMKSHYTIENIE